MRYTTYSLEDMLQSRDPSTEELAVVHSQEDKDKTILIVEDDDQIGTILVEVLKQETPYHPVCVNNGWQALKLIRDLKPCLLITDYRLPHMNGIELYDRVHAEKELADMPTILMSAFLPPMQEVRKRNLIALSKPFGLDEFLEKVDLLLTC